MLTGIFSSFFLPYGVKSAHKANRCVIRDIVLHETIYCFTVKFSWAMQGIF